MNNIGDFLFFCNIVYGNFEFDFKKKQTGDKKRG
jgi:hypothetical protein